MILKMLVIIAAVIGCIYLLYSNGIVTFSSKKAFYFLSKNSFSKKEYSASFKACTGYVKKVIAIKDSNPYTFNLNCNIDSGEIKAILKNSDKKELFAINPETPEAIVNLSEGKYFLTFEMYKAYGNFKLKWYN